MSDSAPSPTPDGDRPIYDRVTTWLLDLSGPHHGDERERTVWFEATALAATLQSLLVMWALAVAAWIAPPAGVPYLVAVLVAFIAPTLLALVHPVRRGVRMTHVSHRPSRSATAASLAILWVPLAVFVVGVAFRFDFRTGTPMADGSWEGAAVGALVGLVLSALGVLLWDKVVARLMPPGPGAGRDPKRRDE